MTAPRFRIIDTGQRSGRENISLDQAMIDAHQAGEIGDTIRFIGFSPVVLVGRHQAVSQEVNVDYCRKNQIEIGRRITGGGAIFMDEDQLGWSLVCNRHSLGGGSLSEVTERICKAVASGLSDLGLDAQYRPRNDIEVGGRKISGTGGFFDGDTLIFQGTVLGDVNPEKMFSALNVPQEKTEKHALGAAAQRVTNLRELLGRAPDWSDVRSAMTNAFENELGIATVDDTLSEAELTRARAIFDDEIGTDDFVYDIDDPSRDASVKVGSCRGAGGAVTAHIRLEGANNDRLREVLITGDFFVTPPRIILDLESSLRRTPIDDIDANVDAFFAGADVGLLSVAPSDFSAAIRSAVAA